MMAVRVFVALIVMAGAVNVRPAAEASAPLIQLCGTNFLGGGCGLYGSRHLGRSGVNYVYAQATGSNAVMRATFVLAGLPVGSPSLHLIARDDDAPAPCAIEIQLNGRILHQGPSGFAADRWQHRRFPVPGGMLRVGTNTLMIVNLERDGRVGMPPWFMVAWCALAGAEYPPRAVRSTLGDDFQVTLPAERRVLPEPLPPGVTQPGFRWRGIKGWAWTPEQYLAEIPVLARYRMNFLMNCYLTLQDGGDNTWWKPLPRSLRRGLEEVVASCRAHDITYCFSINPNLGSSRPLDYSRDRDLDNLWQHFAWMQDLGVRWFSIAFDDISRGMDPAGQARVVNRILARLRTQDPGARMILCPTHYWGRGRNEEGAIDPYLDTLALELDPEVYVFWTGPQVCSARITRRDAAAYQAVVRHRLFLWDNYPVNDRHPTLHLGPVTGRDPDLGEGIVGYLSNSRAPQNEINRIPLLTCADYAYNPRAYDSGRSIGQAILHLAQTPAQREVLGELVELHPGFLIVPAEGYGPASDPALARFKNLADTPGSQTLARLYVEHVADVAARLEALFPDRYAATRRTLALNLAALRALYLERYHDEGMRAPE